MIHVLDQDTINKIAAGEVVERPMAVVKELVENSIDAGAGSVTVEIKDGGKSLIRITDNGSGITKEDIRLAFTPHATSKINNAKDLLSVATLGFRGEALASVASVSQLEMVTKTRDDMTGYRYQIEGGTEKSLDEVGCPEGTTFLVRNLFYNTPARLKFLKTAKTEAGYISSVVERMALSHPEISFKFINQNQPKLNTSGNGNLKDVIYGIYGRDIANNLLTVDAEGKSCSIQGFIGKPVTSRGNRSCMNYFINGRYIKSAVVHRAIEEAYSSYNMQHRYPFTALNIYIAPECIDVNVHPQKMEVRFTNERELYDEIYHIISDILAHREFIPDITFSEKEIPGENTKNVEAPKSKTEQVFNNETKTENHKNPNSAMQEDKFKFPKATPPTLEQLTKSVDIQEKKISSPIRDVGAVTLKRPTRQERELYFQDKQRENEKRFQNEMKSTDSLETLSKAMDEQKQKSDDFHEKAIYNVKQESLFETGVMREENVKDIKIIGQVFSTYWIIQYGQNMYIIDQHAAHEKVLYEKFLKQIQKNDVMVQMISPPVVLSLSMLEKQAVEENMQMLSDIGYRIENFGGSEFMVTGMPAHLPDIDVQSMLMEIIGELAEEHSGHNPEILMERVASMSCKAAVKGNNLLPVEQAKELIKELMTLENPYNCPHGRPTMIKMSKTDLEKKFKRIV